MKDYEGKLQKNSERKFTIAMEPFEGIHLESCRIDKVRITTFSGRSVTLDGANIIRDGADSIKIILVSEDAKALGTVNIKVELYIGIPDSDFADGFRDQIFTICPTEE